MMGGLPFTKLPKDCLSGVGEAVALGSLVEELEEVGDTDGPKRRVKLEIDED